MKEILQTLKIIRKSLGTTQVDLAYLSGVSLPSIQNLEAGRGNPSLETLQSLAECLGLQLNLSVKPINWDELAYLGAPLWSSLTKKQSGLKLERGQFLKSLRQACIELRFAKTVPDKERKIEVVEALLLAVEELFPSVYNELLDSSPLTLTFKARKITGKLIKLKRIAAARLAEYL